MAITKHEKDGQAILKIDGPLNIETLSMLKEELMAALNEHSGIALDLKNVNECDTAGIQLLWSARKTAEGKAKNFSIINSSESLKKAAEQIGIII